MKAREIRGATTLMIVTPQKTTKYCITDSSNAETPVIRWSARAYGPSCRLCPVGPSHGRQHVTDDDKSADAPPDHRRQPRQHIPVSRLTLPYSALTPPLTPLASCPRPSTLPMSRQTPDWEPRLGRHPRCRPRTCPPSRRRSAARFIILTTTTLPITLRRIRLPLCTRGEPTLAASECDVQMFENESNLTSESVYKKS